MIIIDNVIIRYTPHVAYDAHLAGYAFGIVVSILLLSTRLIRGTNVDLWTMIKQWNRRRVYTDVVSGGYDPFTGRTVKRIPSKDVNSLLPEQQKIMEIRAEISNLLSAGNLSGAVAEISRIDTH